MQKDPIGLDAGDPDVYQYNTIHFTDPLGLLSFENNLARRRLSNSGNSIAKSLTSLALGGVFAKRYGTVTILEALRYRLSTATLRGSVGTVGSVAATTALNSLFIGASFELGQEAGNIVGALLDTLVDDLQGGPEIDSSLSKVIEYFRIWIRATQRT